MGQKDNDLEKIEQLIEIMKQNDLLEVEIKHDNDKIFLKRSGGPGQQPAINGIAVVPTNLTTPADSFGQEQIKTGQRPPQAQQQDLELVDIKSPIVGTFYITPSPDSQPYVEIGAHVEPQTVVCVIEAMKVMNEIKADVDGTIAEILVTNGQAVEYGQVLFKVEPD